MEEANATRYWCHMCSQTVDAVMEDEIKCPFCRSGFVEEMEDDHHSSDHRAPTTSSIWAPILMEMMNNSATRNQTVDTETETNRRDLDSQLQEILRRRGRRSVSVLQLLQGVRSGSTLEPESNRDDHDNNNNNNNNNNNGANGERGRVIVINPSNPIIAIPSSVVVGSLSDYFIGPGFEALLQRLAENDPNRYGTPPARKEDVESLATVKIQEPSLQCSVCLEDFEVGIEAKQMPCKHNFHGDCLLPWLELHSSCPVCRYQLPTETDSATTTETNDSSGVVGGDSHATSSSQGTQNSHGNSREGEADEENDDGDRNALFSIPWPFSSLFSSSSQENNPST